MAKSTTRTTKKLLTMPPSASTTRDLRTRTQFTSTEIAVRAFELYCEQGCQDGRDIEDWLRAERELQEKASSPAA
jgi:hypothetical protein